jgi:hypothetical protein
MDIMSGADIEIVVIADPLGGGGASDYPDHPSLAEKEMCENISETLEGGGIVTATAAGIIAVAGPELWGPAVFAGVVSMAMLLGHVGFEHLANDPPDPDYGLAVKVTTLTMQPPATPAAASSGLQPVLDLCNDFIPLVPGVTTAYERAQGASAAGDERWRSAHSHGAQVLLGCVTTRLLQLANRLEHLPSELGAVELTRSDYEACQARARAHEVLPQDIAAVLTGGGLGADDLLACDTAIAEHPTATLPTGRVVDLSRDVAKRLRTGITRLAIG